MAALSTGTMLHGHTCSYRIERMLGSGTFGITYLALVSDGAGPMNGLMRVCVKEFFMHDINGRVGDEVTCSSSGGMFGHYRRKFLREAKNLAQMNHPRIIHVFEAFEQNNTVYYVMEYIDGGSLDDYIACHGSMDEEAALRCVAGIAEGLMYMHSRKMLHLDLKPANVMLKADGSAVLIDFGLSKQYDDSGEPESSTKVGSGTPGYAPVEQANYHEGHGFPVTMDVYALGATLFKMLTGQRPPDSSMVLNDGLPVALLRQRGVSETTITAIEGAMAPVVRQRTPDVATFVKALPQGWAGRGTASAASSSSSFSSSSSSSSSSSVEFVKLHSNLSEGPVCVTSGTASIKVILNGRFVSFTPQTTTVMDMDTAGKRSFASSRQRFEALCERINALHLYATRTYAGDFGYDGLLTVSAIRGSEEYVNATGGRLIHADGDGYFLKGDVAALADIVAQEAGIDVAGGQREQWFEQYKRPMAVIGISVAVILLTLWLGMYSSSGKGAADGGARTEQVDTVGVATVQTTAAALPEICNEREVDLGLPSGTVWAGWNVGASSAEQCGDYYAWGETKTKSEYTNANYFDLPNNGTDFENFKTYYNEGGKTSVRGSGRDVARAKWGSGWALPTREQAVELVAKCSWTWMQYGGVYGYAVTGPNGKSLFMPAAGQHYTGIDSNQKDVNAVTGVGERGLYWTADLYKDYSASAYIISFVQKKHEVDVEWRTTGLTVRAVRER